MDVSHGKGVIVIPNPKHDRQGVRKASDIEQKYDLSLLKDFEKSSENLRELAELNKTFSQYVTNTNARLQKLEKLIPQVGAVHITLSESDPSELFGGEWELIAEGHLLVGLDTESELQEVFPADDKCYIWKRIS